LRQTAAARLTTSIALFTRHESNVERRRLQRKPLKATSDLDPPLRLIACHG
jgi:hypothetical protein